ncbi:ATP-binding cassette domain-containing protein [Francisella sp. 19X1-34]|uniref:ATP-binding cassette domain-containing protein n=1 Tax=Francisella sp. 19X1-34 TaxID=3087177 RepID=UPI002E2FAD5A|nr:ATP-binding cassette domain-containing protein [Francisella sp. 19X1-34]MED7789130.1 ATP-binding cassette domain-containing protein [Francisella sp. 19X1-34]
MLSINNISLNIGRKKLLDDVSFKVTKGSITGILGANGAGKSTLLKLICRDFHNYTGEILLDNQLLKNIPANQLSKQIALVRQHESVSTDIKVIDYVLLGTLAYTNGRLKEDSYLRAIKALRIFEAEMFCQKSYQQLSGGERQRVQLARALVQLNSNDKEYSGYLFLDEYSAHMDIYYQRQTLEILKRLISQNSLAILVIGHDLNIALEYYENSLLLKNSKAIAFDKTKNVLTKHNIQKAFNIDVRLVSLEDRARDLIVF